MNTHALVDPTTGRLLGLGSSPAEAWKHAEDEGAVGKFRASDDEVGTVLVAAAGKAFVGEVRKIQIEVDALMPLEVEGA